MLTSRAGSASMCCVLLAVGLTACHSSASSSTPSTPGSQAPFTIGARPTVKPTGPPIFPVIGELREVTGAAPGDSHLVSGSVVVSTPQGARVSTATTLAQGRFFVQLKEGTYVVTGTTASGATCAPTTLRVSFHSANFARLSCRKPSPGP